MNSRIVPAVIDDGLIAQAADWMARITDPEAGVGDFREWQEWLNASPSHAAAYREIERIWTLTGGLTDEAAPSAPAPAVPRVRARSWFGYAAAASVLLVSVVTGVLAWRAHRHVVYEFETATAEQRSLQLADGSHLVVGAESKVSVDLSADQRRLHLDHGVAYFKVAPDKQRPFLVLSEGYVARAVGTAFAVDSQPHRILVTVEEGIVQVRPDGGTSGEKPLLLHPGQRATVDDGGMRCTVLPKATGATPSWVSGRLEYVHEELRFVIADVNRYTRRKIQIDEPSVGRLRYTGTVFLEHVDEWLATLPGSFPIRLDGTSPDSYQLRATSETAEEIDETEPAGAAPGSGSNHC